MHVSIWTSKKKILAIGLHQGNLLYLLAHTKHYKLYSIGLGYGATADQWIKETCFRKADHNHEHTDYVYVYVYLLYIRYIQNKHTIIFVNDKTYYSLLITIT